MDVRSLQAVVAVADHGGLTRAAAALHLSQSTLSHTISRLESQLGVSLFERLPRGAIPTAAGEELLVRARRILAELDQARAAVAAASGTISGELHVAVDRGSLVLLASLLARLNRDNPLVRVIVHQPDADGSRLLRQHTCELAVMRSDRIPPGFPSVTLGQTETVLLVPNALATGLSEPARPTSLEGRPAVAPSAGTRARRYFDARFGPAGMVVVAESSDQEARIELCRAGLGITVTSRARAVSLDLTGLCVRSLWPSVRTPLSLVCRPGARSAAADALVELARRRSAAG